jgi:regulation of enolase protein 1 (concanavalin A-like superfamily)
VVSAQTVPAGWSIADVGSPAIGGYATFANGTYTVSGAGSDIGGRADQFTFLYRRLTGDGTIIVRVSDLQNTHPWAKAGLMIRHTLAADSRNAFALVTPSNGVVFQRRRGTGGNTFSTNGAPRAVPVWLKLDRRVNMMTASWSSDGVTWTEIGSDSVSMGGGPVYVGLAVTSHNQAAAAVARFTNVQVASLVGYGGALPTGWSSGDIGSPAQPGAAVYDPSSSTFGLRGGGTGISGTSDQFRFAYTQITQDVDIVAQVRALGDTNAWSKVGVMIRESLTPNAAHASVFVSTANGTVFQRRAAGGGTTVSSPSNGAQAPEWVMLSLRNGVVSGYRSNDGVSWTFMGTQTLTLPTPFYVGLAISSHNAAATVEANIDNVRITAAALNQPPAVSLTAPANGAAFTAPATITVSADATDPDGTVARVDFYQGSTLIASDTTSPYGVTWSNVPVGSYSLTAVAIDNVGASTTSAARTITVQGGGLPAGWTAADVGSPSLAGTTTHNAGTFTVNAAGVDIWGTSDQFHFAYQQFSGDVDIVARVATLGQTNAWSKAGVMIRASLAATSTHASMFATGGSGTSFQRRTTTGGTSVLTSGGASQAPVWVKLSRRGATITASQSSNGTTWTQVGSATLTLPTSFYVGLAVTSHDANARVNATFDGVVVQAPAANQPPNVALTAPANGATFTAPANITISATVSDTDGTIARVEFYQGSTLIAADTTSPYSITWSNVPAGTYSLTARATDDDGATTTSAARSITVTGTNQPPSVALTAPGNGATFTAPANITISATASDTDGTIARVEFYQGSTLIAADTTSPYSITWSNVPAGTYSLTARATDNGGATTTSAARSITVTAAPVQRSVVFSPSPDHNTLVNSYLFEVFPPGADTRTATPIASQNLGKPAPVNGEITADVTTTINGLAPGNYQATVASVGNGGTARSGPITFTR